MEGEDCYFEANLILVTERQVSVSDTPSWVCWIIRSLCGPAGERFWEEVKRNRNGYERDMSVQG